MLLPFNQASAQDVAALVAHVYADPKAPGGGLGLDLDYVIPFGALPDAGAMDDLAGPGTSASAPVSGGASELAHRGMLTNVLRLLGAVAAAKRARGVLTHPALAVLPLSPNHGVFGGDGLYSESKLGLEALQASRRAAGGLCARSHCARARPGIIAASPRRVVAAR